MYLSWLSRFVLSLVDMQDILIINIELFKRKFDAFFKRMSALGAKETEFVLQRLCVQI